MTKSTTVELLRQGQRDDIWKRYCGFLDLDLSEVMEIQKRLLMEQIQLLSECELGRKLLGDTVPETVEEFRDTVPLTSYEPYVPYLLEQKEDALPAKPLYWIHTSGRSGEYRFKWVPVSAGMFHKWAYVGMAGAILATCQKKGDIALEENAKFLYCLAPLPYTSGLLAHAVLDEFPFEFMPPVEESESMSFQERIEKGFMLSFRKGLDIFFGLSSVLVRMGESFTEQSGQLELSSDLLHPRSVFRIGKALVRKQIAGRPILPSDLWDLKGIMTSGMDTPVYKDKIKHYWGKYPLEMYGGSEFGLVALQTWDYDTMTFVPDLNFLEFITEEDHLKSRQDPSYQPRTLLLDELQAGEVYEIVITNFDGGTFVRYRVGDMVRIMALRNEKLDINLPQMIFETRCDDVIDLANFARLTERVIWKALEESGVRYVDWAARKEFDDQQPVLRLYVELRDGETRDEGQIEDAVHSQLEILDSDYRDIGEMLGLQPLRVTLFPAGAFGRYIAEKQAAGADPAHMKPPHMRPSDEIIAMLLMPSAQGS